MQHHPADELHVEVAHADRADGGLAHGRESARQDLLHRLGLSLAQLLLQTLHLQPQLILSVDVGLLQPFLTGQRQIIAQRAHTLGDRRAEGIGLPAQLVVAHALELGRERVDLIYDRLQTLGFALTGIAKGFSYQVFEHGCYS